MVVILQVRVHPALPAHVRKFFGEDAGTALTFVSCVGRNVFGEDRVWDPGRWTPRLVRK